MNIDQMCEHAKENGFDSMKFTFTNLTGKEVTCKWLDAYFGLFQVEGQEGFITVKQWKEHTGDIFNLQPVS